MKYKLRNFNDIPSCGYTWKDPDTKVVITASNYYLFLDRIKDHRFANGYASLSNEEVESCFCEDNFVDATTGKLVGTTCLQSSSAFAIKGVGSILEDLMGVMGIVPCWGCLSLSNKMNKLGIDGCKENIDSIVLEIEANANKREWFKVLPFKKLGIKALVLKAISIASKELKKIEEAQPNE